MLLGSCFTDHIGQWLSDAWLPVMCNPYGVLFNPASIANTLLRLLGNDLYLPVLHEHDGRYYSFDHHGKWSSSDADALTQQLIDLETEARTFLSSAQHLIITFGTSWVYEREGSIVANCHKFPASEFTRRKLSVDEIVKLWSQVIETFTSPQSVQQTIHHSSLLTPHFTFTVSPIRHVKDTLHGNQLSKATLLLAIEELQQRYPAQVQYLPVYELFMDDLRDYRFYADDLVHPSSMAIEMVKDLFVECAMTPAMQQFMHDAAPIVRALQHKPSDPDAPQYKIFLEETLKKKEKLLRR